MTNKIYNFSAGPSKLPEAVIEIAKNELSNWHGKGFSIMTIPANQYNQNNFLYAF